MASLKSNRILANHWDALVLMLLLVLGGIYLDLHSRASALPGDINGDGIVNITDLSILATNWSKTGQTQSQGDLNGDGSINILDLSILAANWGKTATSNGPTVPTGLVATATSSSQINLTWTASTDTGATPTYIIYRGGVQIATSASTSYQNTGLTPNTAYVYTVAATDANGTSAQSSAASATTQSGTGSIWQPAQNTDWQWEIGNPLSTSNATQMGTGVTAWNGDTAPGDNPKIIDTDGILNPASTITALHSLGIKAICYIEVGTAGNYYSASDEGIPTTYYDQLKAAGDLGSVLSGYSSENFVNITAASAVTIEEAQILQQCVSKGFDGVETDLDETWGGEEGSTGFGTFTQAQEETFLTTLANYMHTNGIAWIAKNLDDEGSASFVSDMQPLAQGMISEECNVNSSCNLLSSFLSAGKWIGNAEYTQDGETTAKFCSSDNSSNINGVLFDVNLDGTKARQPCR